MAAKAHPLEVHLARFTSAPFLFVGAGISRRYLSLENWEGLLRRYAAITGKPYEYYFATANGAYLEIATLIAADLHERWWVEDDFEESRREFSAQAVNDESALKIEIAKYLRHSLDNLSTDRELAKEIELLKSAVVDGVITTNFDPLLEHIFDSFRVFVGQDQLLFSDPQGIGEIYKIHGSYTDPNSLVLTTRDFDRFKERNPYLAAKLLTIFVEHPVIFIGYSLTDDNVREILTSIATILTEQRLGELQDRLIFVRWDERAPRKPTMTASAIVAGDATIPVHILQVRDFASIFEALSHLERRFPARVLRQLKEHVYELVRDNDPKERLYVQDFDADLGEVDVVLGVGAISKIVRPYKGLDRKDLLVDVVTGGGDLDPVRILSEVLPTIPVTTHVPFLKYLSEAGLLDAEGKPLPDAQIHPRVRARFEKIANGIGVVKSYERRASAAVAASPTFNQLAKTQAPVHTLLYAPALDLDKLKPEELRQFLVAHRTDMFETEGEVFAATEWARSVCFYDWLRYGRTR